MKKNLNEKVQLQAQNMTPVFIGDGKEHSQLDYFTYKNELYFVDISKILEHFEQKEGKNVESFVEEIKGLIEKNFRKGYWKGGVSFFSEEWKKEIVDNEVYNYKINFEDIGNNLIESHIRQAGFHYIPGSSIKGAIRTAILYKIIKEHKDLQEELYRLFDGLMNSKEKKPKPMKELERFEKKVFYPKGMEQDSFRCLQISDFSYKDYQAQVIPLLKYGMNNENIYEDPQKFIYAECVVNGVANGTMKLNIEDLHNTFTKYTYDYLSSVEKIKEVVNEYTYGFFKELLKNYKWGEKEKNNITSMLQELEKDGGEHMYLFVGGHNGWFAKSLRELVYEYGNFNPEKTNQKWFTFLRGKLDMGKNPKTKKYVLKFPKTVTLGSDKKPLGLLKIKLKSEESIN